MQCEFSKSELIDLDMCVMERAASAGIALSRGQGVTERLKANYERLDALHKKLNELIEKASAGAGR